MTIGQLLSRMDAGSTIDRVYIFRLGNLVEWYQKENIRDNCYLGWADKEIISFEVFRDTIRIEIA